MEVETRKDVDKVRLPRQLSQAVLSRLLEDLVEFNGFAYKPVPQQITFSERYVALYFSKVHDEDCQRFLPILKSYYSIMNDKFECVLVSLDSCEEDYFLNTRRAVWPTFEFCDYRVELLRTHFAVRQVPHLVVLDPNGMVVTADGVRHIVEDDHGFPWCEPIFEKLWGEHLQGVHWNIINQLNLPPYMKVRALKHDVVGLVFGEPWCPDTRAVLERIAFLNTNVAYRGRHAYCAFYFVHGEPLSRFADFLGSELTFPSVHVEDPEKLAAVQHYLGVEGAGTFVVVSPKDVWCVRDGTEWLYKDPTGLLFPWLPFLRPGNDLQERIQYKEWAFRQRTEPKRRSSFELHMDSNISSTCRVHGPLDMERINFCDCVKELKAEHLASALWSGPCFVAILTGSGPEQSEALANLRLAAVAYRYCVNRGGFNTEVEELLQPGLGLRELLVINEHGLETLGDELAERIGVPSRGRPVSKPSDADQHERCTMHSVRSMGGPSPWNEDEKNKEHSEHCALSFYYCSAEDRVVHLLRRFCEIDQERLKRHVDWNSHRSEKEQLNSTTITQLENLWFEAKTGTNPTDRKKSLFVNLVSHRRGSGDRGQVIAPLDTGAEDNSENASETDSDHSSSTKPNRNNDNDTKRDNRSHLPRVEFPQVSRITERHLGPGDSNLGTGVLIDLSRGSYFICGSFKDKSTLSRFLEAWYLNELDPFSVGIVTTEEMTAEAICGDYNGSLGIPRQLNDPLIDIPTLIIWIPSSEHAKHHSGPAALYRAFLSYAHSFNRTVRAKEAVTRFLRRNSFDEPNAFNYVPNQSKQTGDPVYERQDLIERKFQPIIQWFWIFGLEVEKRSKALGARRANTLNSLRRTTAHISKLTSRTLSAYDVFKQAPQAYMEEVHIMTTVLLDNQENGENKQQGSTKHDDDGLETRDSRWRPAPGNGIQYRNSLVMRELRNVPALQESLADELSYALNVQCPQPPVSIVIFGDLPLGSEEFFWPSALSSCGVHVVGRARNLTRFRERVAPSTNVVAWEHFAAQYDGLGMTADVISAMRVPWPERLTSCQHSGASEDDVQ